MTKKILVNKYSIIIKIVIPAMILLSQMYFVNIQREIGIAFCFIAYIYINVFKDYFDNHKNIKKLVFFSLALEVVWIGLQNTKLFFFLNIVWFILIMILLCNDEKFKSIKKVNRNISLVILLFIEIFVIFAVFMPDLTAMISRLIYRVEEDTFIAKNENSLIYLENGNVLLQNIRYDESAPNSYLDIYLSKVGDSYPKPTYIYIHGGAYIIGDKTYGSYGAKNTNISEYFNEFLNNGINVISINYALAPEYRHPSALLQFNESIKYILDNVDTYGIDSSKLILGGTSAGGHIVGQFVNIQSNLDYAEKMGIEQTIPIENIKSVLLMSTLYDARRFAETDSDMYNFVFDKLGKSYFDTDYLKNNQELAILDIIENLNDNFPPVFVSDGNCRTFDKQSKEFINKANNLGIKNYFNYVDEEIIRLNHAFEERKSEEATENVKKQVIFVLENL